MWVARVLRRSDGKRKLIRRKTVSSEKLVSSPNENR
jgi:hypothetical protein